MLYLHLQNVQTEIRFVCKDLSKKKGVPLFIYFSTFSKHCRNAIAGGKLLQEMSNEVLKCWNDRVSKVSVRTTKFDDI